MPFNASFKRASIIENSPVILMARIADALGIPVTAADVDSLTIKVFNQATGTQISTTIEPTVSDVIFDTLQEDNRWLDEDGYNFAYEVDGSYFPDGNTKYQVEVKVTPSDTEANPFILEPWVLSTINVFGE